MNDVICCGFELDRRADGCDEFATWSSSVFLFARSSIVVYPLMVILFQCIVLERSRMSCWCGSKLLTDLVMALWIPSLSHWIMLVMLALYFCLFSFFWSVFFWFCRSLMYFILLSIFSLRCWLN